MPRLLIPLTVLAAIACRAWLHFTTALVPGMNGGYYLVQARSLLEKQALAIPDLPLVFTLQACLAGLVKAVSSLDLDHSVMLAVKLADSALPAFAVVPVLLLASAWSKGGATDRVIAVLAALGVAAGPAALSMVGEFEKNSLGLALLCGLVWAMRRWVLNPGRGTALTAVLVLGLIGITHIGVFGTALVFVLATFATLTVAQGREGLMRVGRLLLAAIPVVLIAGALVFWKFDPSRINKLLHAFSEPADYLAGGMMGPMPGGMAWLQWVPSLLCAALVITAATVAWRSRSEDRLANLSIITGAALTVVAITGPWVHGDKVMRFYLNATPLIILCALFAVLRIPRPGVKGLVGGIAFGGMFAIGAATSLAGGGRPIISEQAATELSSLAPLVKDPASTLVVARHGLEWWTAWTLHTHIAQAQAVTAEDWKNFKDIWFIEAKQGMGGGPMGFGPPRGPGGPPGKRPRGWFGRLFGGPPGPPEMGPPARGGPPGRPPPGGPHGGGPGGPAMMGAPIPEGAEIIHNGELFKAARVAAAPDFVMHRETITGGAPR